MTATASEIKTATYRIFKKGDLPGINNSMWNDLGVEPFEGRYSPRPDAEQLGTRHGEGQYMYFEAEKNYATVEFLTVVAETVYREVRDEAEALS